VLGKKSKKSIVLEQLSKGEGDEEKRKGEISITKRNEKIRKEAAEEQGTTAWMVSF